MAGFTIIKFHEPTTIDLLCDYDEQREETMVMRRYFDPTELVKAKVIEDRGSVVDLAFQDPNQPMSYTSEAYGLLKDQFEVIF